MLCAISVVCMCACDSSSTLHFPKFLPFIFPYSKGKEEEQEKKKIILWKKVLTLKNTLKGRSMIEVKGKAYLSSPEEGGPLKLVVTNGWFPEEAGLLPGEAGVCLGTRYGYKSFLCSLQTLRVLTVGI